MRDENFLVKLQFGQRKWQGQVYIIGANVKL